MIEIKEATVKFGGDGDQITALSSLSLRIEKGEHVAILGPNGSGKSTLAKAICGLIPLDAGEISMLGKPVRPGAFGQEFFGEIGVVFQEPQGQFIMRSVRAEIASVLQNLGLSIEGQEARIEKIVSRFQLSDIILHRPEDLSGGQMQIVNLACALCIQPRVLILDEPTTFLDLHYRGLLMDYLYSPQNSEITIIHITQFPDESLHSQRICILDGGMIVFDGLPDDILHDDIFLRQHRLTIPRRLACEKILGFQGNDLHGQDSFCSRIEMRPHRTQIDLPLDSRFPPVVLSIDNLKFEYSDGLFSLNIENLYFHREEITALVGPAGSGKSTLAFLLAGLREPEKGQISFAGSPLASYPMRELRRAIGLTWQMPDFVMIGPTVKDDIEFGLENLGIDSIDIESVLAQVDLAGFENRIVDTLSGGEKRKLSLAGILATRPEYLILDEPAAFLDTLSILELIEVIRKTAVDGRGILIIGHDLEFISELAQRVIGIKDGRILFDVPATEFFSDGSFLVKLGLPPSPMVRFRQKLLEQGLAIPFASLNPEKIVEYLKSMGIM